MDLEAITELAPKREDSSRQNSLTRIGSRFWARFVSCAAARGLAVRRPLAERLVEAAGP